MASPVVQEAIESSTNTAGTSHVVTLPTATAGQLLLIILDKGSTAATIDAHASLTELLDENSANGLYIAYRWMDGSEPASYTLTSSANTRSARIAYRISGAINPATQPPVIGTTATGTSATPDPPASATPTGTKDFLVIAFAGMAGEEADDDTWGNTPPTNYTPNPPRQKSCGTAGTNLGGLILSAERALTTGSAENPGTFGVDVSAAWRAQTILIYPAEATQYTSEPTATLSFSGAASKRTSTARTGALSFSGAVTTIKSANAFLTASLSFAGAATRSTAHVLSGALGFAGATAKSVARAVSGALGFTGAIAATKLAFMSLTASMSFAGSLAERTSKALAATLSSTAAMSRATARAHTASLALQGAVARRAGKAVSAVLAPAAALTRRVGRSLAGVLSTVGEWAGVLEGGAQTFFHSMTATVSFTGGLARSTSRALSGALGFVGSWAGVIVTPQLYQHALTASISFAGGLAKRTERALSAAAGFTGYLIRLFRKAPEDEVYHVKGRSTTWSSGGDRNSH